MKRVRWLLLRAFIGALLLLPLGASVANADGRHWHGSHGSPGGSWQTLAIPEDPGFE